jgi:replication fork protection complex subunit Csm3/Swi3
MWLDDLFPKAKFLDALAMVEKAGHKTIMHKMRMEWIDEGKPKRSIEDDFAELLEDGPEQTMPTEPAKLAPIFEKSRATPARTGEDLFDDGELYNATPRVNGRTTEMANGGEVPDAEEDLDALLAETEALQSTSHRQGPSVVGISQPMNSIFGGDSNSRPSQAAGEPDEDDLDALMAEAEAGGQPAGPKDQGNSHAGVNSIFGDGKAKELKPVSHEEDDLDALMAESEADTAVTSKAATNGKGGGDFADDEEAMAEMEGLW